MYFDTWLSCYLFVGISLLYRPRKILIGPDICILFAVDSVQMSMQRYENSTRVAKNDLFNCVAEKPNYWLSK